MRVLFGPTHSLTKFGGRMGWSERVGTFGHAAGACASSLPVHVNRFGQARSRWVALLEMPCIHFTA
jgi:hypothetical protein